MRRFARIFCSLGGFAWLAAAQAQLPLPNMPLPQVQVPALPVDPALRDVDGPLRSLPSRALRATALYRANRGELERDPGGELVVRAEVIAIDIGAAALEGALAEKFVVVRTQDLSELGVKITVLQTPPGWSARRGLKRLRKLDPGGSYDFNHVYLDSGAVDSRRVVSGVMDARAPAGAGTRVGLVDGGVDATHIALRDNVLHRNGCNGALVPSAHGTAVASLLVGSAREFQGAAPRAELFAADVYCGAPTGGAVDAVASAFSWLARERVPVINVSLVGPRNALLEHVVGALVVRGHLIVAAVGNDGPAAPPLYPAAYEGVIGVTAVDGKRRVLLEACRGKHLDLAAPGADLAAAGPTPEGFTQVRGTSFAAPMVAGLLALQLRAPDPAASQQALAALMASAIDLGTRGRDNIYGAGLVSKRTN